MGKRGPKPNVEKNAEIVRLYDAHEVSIGEIAKRYGLSKQRINQIVYPERARARRVVYAQIRLGRMVRPTACAQCGTRTENLEAHHSDYLRQLDVVWLCVKCHAGAEHKRRGRRPRNLSQRQKTVDVPPEKP